MLKEDIDKLEEIKDMCLEYAAAIEVVKMNKATALNLDTLHIGLGQAYDELNDIISRNSPEE